MSAMEDLLFPNLFWRHQTVSNRTYTSDLTKIKEYPWVHGPYKRLSWRCQCRDVKTSSKSSKSTPAPIVVYMGARNLISRNIEPASLWSYRERKSSPRPRPWWGWKWTCPFRKGRSWDRPCTCPFSSRPLSCGEKNWNQYNERVTKTWLVYRSAWKIQVSNEIF